MNVADQNFIIRKLPSNGEFNYIDHTIGVVSGLPNGKVPSRKIDEGTSERVFEFLLQEGFMVVPDKSKKRGKSAELTERGRKYKRWGNLKLLLLVEWITEVKTIFK